MTFRSDLAVAQGHRLKIHPVRHTEMKILDTSTEELDPDKTCQCLEFSDLTQTQEQPSSLICFSDDFVNPL